MSLTKHHLVTLVLALGPAFPAFAEVLHWPQFCTNGELHLKNPQTEKLTVWLQKFGDGRLSETDFDLPPSQTTVIPLDPAPADERYSLLHFYPSGNFSALYKCGGRIYPVSAIEGGALTFKKSDLDENKLWLRNLFTAANTVLIELQNRNLHTVYKLTLRLEASEGRLFKISAPDNAWSYLRVTASNRASVFNLTSAGAEVPAYTAPQESAAEAASAYFVVGPRDGRGDTFIARIRDPQMAERARDLIRNPQKEKMMFATIQKDHQGFNRNWSRREKNFWSWSVTDVTNFDDFGSTACNGSPQEVEDRVDAKIINPGRICFWDYRVKKELTASEVSGGISSSP